MLAISHGLRQSSHEFLKKLPKKLEPTPMSQLYSSFLDPRSNDARYFFLSGWQAQPGHGRTPLLLLKAISFLLDTPFPLK